uniref:Uncharacterized protein n=1 Tax=Arundo donax TaxID=35708 RepID=A0A0A9ECV1_ARUDO
MQLVATWIWMHGLHLRSWIFSIKLRITLRRVQKCGRK